MSEERKFYSVREAAAVLGVGPALLSREVVAGRVYSIKIGARRLIPVHMIEALANPDKTPNGKTPGL